MKLVTFTIKKRHSRPAIGILENGYVNKIRFSYENMVTLVSRGIKPSPGYERYAIDEVELKAPICPGKIICVGRNYAEHAKELGNEIPEAPLLFAKMPSSVIGINETITWRESLTTKVDWEGELAVIIGKPARHVSEDEAMNHVFGYTVGNDVSARDLQDNDRMWIRAKGLDTFGPLGPAIVTADEIDDPHNLNIKTMVNDEEMQNSNTSHMMFKIPYLISYISQAFTLNSGDIILTGTPSGVGKGMKPPRFLTDGDVVKVTIENIGELTNPCAIEAEPVVEEATEDES